MFHSQVELNLTSIAMLILSEEQGKTGMRRLYDVANILETLGLIKRHGKIQKKPSFMYCGPRIVLSDSGNYKAVYISFKILCWLLYQIALMAYYIFSPDLKNQYVGSIVQNIDYCDTSSGNFIILFFELEREWI